MLTGLYASHYSGTHHLVGFSAEGGWSTFLTNMPQAHITPRGGEGGLHMLYEYQHSGFLIQTGIGFAYQRVNTAMADSTIYHTNMHDGDLVFTLKHQFTGRNDMAQQLYGRVPFYLGHYFFGPQGIGYFLAGVQAGYAFWGSTKQKAIGTTTGYYEKFVSVMEEMDNHGFRKDVPIERTGGQLKLKLDVLAHAEFGYEYNMQLAGSNNRTSPSNMLDRRIRIAAYADFGILSIMPASSGFIYSLPMATIYDFPTYGMDHLFTSEEAAANYWLRNLSVGLRVTFLFGNWTQSGTTLYSR